MSETSLLDRDRETATLHRALEAAVAGRGGVVLLEGPAGIGKTALIDAVGPLAREHDALVLGARASELDRGFAFGVVLQLLEQTLDSLSADAREQLFAGAAGRAIAVFEHAASGDADPEYGVLSGLAWLVANLAEERPLVLRVDDLHWADVASVRFLEFLGRRVDELPVLVVGSMRPNEPDAPAAVLTELAAGPAAQTLLPGALGEHAIGAILGRELGGEPAPAFVTAARVATGGNPLLVTVLGRESAASGLRGLEAEAQQLTEIGSRGVARIVERRLRTLGPDAVTVARATAVAGERAPVDDVVALSGLAPDAAHRAVDALVAAAMLAPGGRAFVHPLVRSAVVASTPRGELMRLHRDCATRLRERGARQTEVASHWLAAQPSGSADAVADLYAAARIAAAEGATETAVELLARALEEPPPAADRPRVLAELGELELRAQRPHGAERLHEALAAGLDGEDAVRARAALAFVLVHNDPQAAFTLAEQARAQTADPALRLRLEAFVAEALIFVDAFAGQRDAWLEAAAAAVDPSPVMLAHVAVQASMAGAPPRQTLELARRATAGGALVDDVGQGGSTWNLLTHALRFAEDAEACGRLLTDGENEIRRRGLQIASLFVNQSWGYWHRDFGSVATGAARSRLGLDAVRALDLDVTTPALAAITAENLLLLDRAQEAAEIVDGPLGAAEGTFVEPFVRSARGLVRAHLRRGVDAEEDFRHVIAAGDARGWRAPFATRGRLRLAELLAMRGERDEALELADHDVAVARAAGTPGALGAALRVRARALGGDAIEQLQEAVETLAGSPLRMERAWALHDLGALLRRSGKRSDARAALRPALDLATRAESTLLSRLVRAELEAAGGRPRRELLSGAEALTPSERRTAELAAEGLSNREIAEALWVTRKTVEHHLGHAYGKLGINSRSGLADALGLTAAAG
ncbi:helix-turn-helix transcriptional regulator [Conexibacter woesei]|uniref:Transcriptional regulator, LuxR family n=1 Tax=Conexibacter woesei (strain DSM 14684 / CCUG 47730 / CIP 108061 / JCM 11494 / NBRC 100937 / ID131577) TaxID=469383 RepID=D3EYY3_CONWI|nr:AAA family ATPase [Conexibacter woesei]ADB49857.1 transcriptional regulator, LuxR family [Conexibacter woesei DSM 14684]